jgi:hypothetical protein
LGGITALSADIKRGCFPLKREPFYLLSFSFLSFQLFHALYLDLYIMTAYYQTRQTDEDDDLCLADIMSLKISSPTVKEKVYLYTAPFFNDS